MRILAFTLVLLLCYINNSVEAQPDADSIINKSIKTSGGELIPNSTIEFDFRGKRYKAVRDNGVFYLSKLFMKDSDTIEDILSNDGLKSFKNGEVMNLPDHLIQRYSASVNSVHYFSVLPYGLNDPAVNKYYLGEVEIKGNKYFKIKVTFDEEGGGEDFDDVFIYWVDKESYKVDYLAYSFKERYGKGYRFRVAYNERFIEGIRFVDYKNYKTKTTDIDLIEIDKMFEKDQLELLSKIELENIKVTL